MLIPYLGFLGLAYLWSLRQRYEPEAAVPLTHTWLAASTTTVAACLLALLGTSLAGRYFPKNTLAPSFTLHGAYCLVFGLAQWPHTLWSLPFSWQRLSWAVMKQAFFYFFRLAGPLTLLSFLWGALLDWGSTSGYWAAFPAQSFVDKLRTAFEGGWTVTSAGLVVLLLILAPVSEEFLFRGALYPALRGRLPGRAAAGLSALLFAVLHGSLRGSVPLFFLGYFLAKSYEHYRNIFIPIAVHSLFNLNSCWVTLYL